MSFKRGLDGIDASAFLCVLGWKSRNTGKTLRYGSQWPVQEMERSFSMVTSLFRKLWMELRIALDPMVTIEGFELTGIPLALLPNCSDLEPGLKRRLAICNLFINHRQSIADIARVLDTGKGKVVNTLIEEGVIKERRHPKPRHVKHERRRHSLTAPSPQLGLRAVGTTSSDAGQRAMPLPRFQTLFGTEPTKSPTQLHKS